MDKLIIRIHQEKQGNVYPVTAYAGTADDEGKPNVAGFRPPMKTRELDTLQRYAEKWRVLPEYPRVMSVSYFRLIVKALWCLHLSQNFNAEMPLKQGCF